MLQLTQLLRTRTAENKEGTLEGKLSSPCEANPKEVSSSHSGREDVSGEHQPGPGEFRTLRRLTRSFGPSSSKHGTS